MVILWVESREKSPFQQSQVFRKVLKGFLPHQQFHGRLFGFNGRLDLQGMGMSISSQGFV